MRHIVALVAVFVIGVGIFCITNRNATVPALVPVVSQNQSTSTVPIEQKENETQALRTPPVGQKEYRNAKYHFSLLASDGLAVREFDEGGGASTITFQDVKNAQGFQIFIVPYVDSQITDAQFKKDEPSGVRLDSQDITIDGSTAASFYSKNTLLGDTAEIWFIRGGYLYETTAPKSLAPWLSDIMLTWKFL